MLLIVAAFTLYNVVGDEFYLMRSELQEGKSARNFLALINVLDRIWNGADENLANVRPKVNTRLSIPQGHPHKLLEYRFCNWG